MAKPIPKPPSELRSLMEQADLSAEEFAGFFNLPASRLAAWIEGQRAAPPWVSPALRCFGLLSQRARHQLLQRKSVKPRVPVKKPAVKKASAKRAPATAPASRHPFSRIEDL